MTASIEASLGPIADAVDARLRRLDREQVVPRIWRRDHTVWRADPTEIENRLGWLTAPFGASRHAADLTAFAESLVREGLTHAVLLGMGGSSLAPEVYRRVLGVREGMLDLRVLDTTHPDAIAALEAEVPLDRTLFVVSSKSGATVETRSHMAYFLERVGEARRFVAITDPGTSLESEARTAGFRRVFSAPPDVGGRYSALTVFGLLPAALIGADLVAILQEATEAASACGGGVRPAGNPGAALGAILGEAALARRDKLTLLLPEDLSALGAWAEQLVAESTGKDGRGILPVDLEPRGDAAVYGDDRLFVTFGDQGPAEPWCRLVADGPPSLGGAMMVLEVATAVAGQVLGIHPFDQPDVQEAKDRTAEILGSGVPDEQAGDLDALLEEVQAGDYVAIQAFVAPRPETWDAMQAARTRVRDRLRVATTVGYGPRYLHSTGQLHKGGPPTGVFVQVLEDPNEDRPVPGQGFTFAELLTAQAAGDLAALRARGRRVARVLLDDLLAWSG